MAIITKNIGTSTVEIGSHDDFKSFTLREEIGTIGPFTLSRSMTGVGYELSSDNEVSMRISIKDLLMECALELAAEIERRAS